MKHDPIWKDQTSGCEIKGFDEENSWSVESKACRLIIKLHEIKLKKGIY
jgi:hypothetical protein